LGSFPWYVYAGAGGLLFLFGNTVARIATETLKAIQEEEEKTRAAAGAGNGVDSNAKL
jgi:hypothetical protein